jgi:hypothetical protein
MVGLQVNLRAVILAASVATAVLGGSCSCPDHVIGVTPQGYPEPACVWLISPNAFLADGSDEAIGDPRFGGGVGKACLCITQEEFDALGERLDRVRFPEEGTLLEEFNEVAYEECKRLAALIDDVVDDECLEYYEGGIWLKDISFARGESADAKPPGFTCYE